MSDLGPRHTRGRTSLYHHFRTKNTNGTVLIKLFLIVRWSFCAYTVLDMEKAARVLLGNRLNSEVPLQFSDELAVQYRVDIIFQLKLMRFDSY